MCAVFFFFVRLHVFLKERNRGRLFCPVRCSPEEIPSKGVEKNNFKGPNFIGVKSFNRLIILKWIIIKSNVTSYQSKSRYRHHRRGRPKNRTENRTEQLAFCSWFLGINSRLGNEFPDFGLRDFFFLIFCVVTSPEGGHGTEQRTERNSSLLFLVFF